MMELDYDLVEKKINYKFDKRELLLQAFTRNSFSEEQINEKIENNEVLEFFGDRVLDLVISQELIDCFGSHNKFDFLFNEEPKKQFECIFNQGELTNLKSKLVDKEFLAKEMDELKFNKLIRESTGDEEQKVEEGPKVKCDLFEAIIGAAFIDSDYDYNRMICIVRNMMPHLYSFISEYKVLADNTICKLREFLKSKGYKHEVVTYHYFDKETDEHYNMYECLLKLQEYEKTFTVYEDTQAKALCNASKLMIEYLSEELYEKI